MQLEREIKKAASTVGVIQTVIEKDFALGYVLSGLARHPVLSKTLVFKGGTALKKCYFGNYRFSEDLDFSAIDAPRMAKLEKTIREALGETQRLLNQLGPFLLELTRYTEKQPHPKDQEAFKVGIRFPWQKYVNCQVKIEISHHEPVLLLPSSQKLLHHYDTPLDIEIPCYQLDEIVAEKMRTLLQSHQKLIANTWHRPRARDYYDLWHIFNTFGEQLTPKRLPELLEKKAIHAEVSYTSVTDFFTPELVKEAQDNWDSNLGAFVKDLPPCEEVLSQLKQIVPRYFPNLVAVIPT